MIKKQISPTYLPSIDSQLEHRAGLRFKTAEATAATTTKQPAAARPWLGSDFTSTVVARETAA